MNHVSATIGTRAVDPRKLADDKFNKRMGNFDKICKQIDAKHDHVMEMLADIQEQLRNLERKQRKEAGVRFCAGDAQFQHQMAAIKPTPSLSPLFSTFQPSPQTPPPPSQMEAIKPSLLPPYIISEIDAYEDAEMLVDEQKVFDEIPESENSKISVISPLVHGSEIAEVYDFGVLNPQFQTPLVSTQEIKMEPEGLSLILSPSSFSSNSDGTKLEDEGSVEVPIYTTVTELQPRESESGFEVFPNLSIRELFPSGRIIVSSLLHSPFLYNCYNGDGLTKEELKWLDTGQNFVVSDFSRDGVGFDLIVCWNLMNKMCWDKNTLVSGMQLKDSWSEWGEIKIVVRGANNHEQNSGALQIQELVHCVSLYMMNFTCLAFAYDPGICCMCWNESLVHVSEILLNNFVAANLNVGLHGVKVLKNVSVFHHSLVNPTVGLEDAIPLQEINSLHTAEGGQVDQDLMSALKEFGLAKFHFTANGFGNDPLHCFKVYFKPNKLLLNCEINNVVHSWSICHQDKFQNSATFVRVEGCLYQCLISLIRVDRTKYSDIEHYIHECGGVGRFRKTVGHYKEKKNLEATLVFDPGDLDFFSLNIGDNSVEVVIFGGISIAFSSWHIVSGFYFYYQGSESNHYNYHSLKDVNVQQNCVAAFVGEAVEFEVVSIEVVTWGKKVEGSECPENQRNESGGLIASLWALEINFELRLLKLVVVATECQIFEAKLQVKTTTKSSLELDLTNEKQRLNCRLVLEDGFVCAAVFEAYGCPSKMFDRPPLKPPFQFRHLSLEDKTHSRGEYCHVHGYGGSGLKEDEGK